MPQCYHYRPRHLSLTLFVLFLLFISHSAAAIPFLGEKYTVSIKVTDQPKLEKQLNQFIKKQQSSNEQLKGIDNLPQYQKLLSALLQKKMKSIGYYDFGVSITNSKSDIAFLIQPGLRATIASIDVIQPQFILEDLKQPIYDAGLKLEQPLIASTVLKAEQKLIAYINEHYCFVQPKLDKNITLDTLSKKAHITFTLDTEPGKSIRNINFEGNASIDSDFLKNLTQIKSGCYKSETIRKAQTYLLQSGLLSSATPELIPVDDQVDILFHVNERKHRTQSLGIGYSTEEGVRFSAGWENRNWRGNGKKLSTDFKISQLTTQVDTALRVPQFKDPDLDLIFQGALTDTKVEAFDSVSAEASVILEYQLNSKWLLSAGVAGEYSQVQTDLQDEIYRLISFPMSVRRDSTRNLLDPVQGSVFTFSIAPYIDLLQRSTQFTQFASSLSAYRSPKIFGINQEAVKGLTLAGRIAMGTITGEPLEAIPADQRYYVGGGGSVRGFDYQSLSPRNNGTIIGGLSFVEIATELRARFTETWGASLFVDAGAGYEEQTPDFSTPLSIGGGVGLRYMTSFAPIRIDIAWPLSSPYEINKTAQLYVGLKQAF